MIKIKIPNNNIEERKYIIKIIFKEFFELDYTLLYDAKHYEIVFKNQKKLIIEDTFFNKYPKNLEYLHLKNIPMNIENLDIFAQIFFMLTRWEEYVNKNRDTHNRFPATESLAYKQKFLDKPIVDEKLEVLKNKFLTLDPTLKFKSKKDNLILTHDIDNPYFWNNSKQLIKIVAGDLLKRHSFNLAINRIKEYYLVKKNKIKDPFDTFDWLMDQSECIGIKSRFYFMSGGITKFDNTYNINNPKILELIQKIKHRGHIIGIHPSYDAYANIIQFSKEKKLLEAVIGKEVTEGREHYLRFEVPTTWQIWEDNNMTIDSTCGYADREGYRCGTGNEFSVFNILTRQQLKLKERPLVFMDSRDFNCNGHYSRSQFDHHLFEYLQNPHSSITILFHNDIFKRDPYYIKEYQKVLHVWN